MYMPLPILESICKDSSMNFILGLPQRPRQVHSIMRCLTTFSKISHFIPCKKSADASYIAHLFSIEVVKLHGVSKSITCDKDVKFTSHFQQELWKKLDTTLKFSGVFHPYVDGKTVVVNMTLWITLRCLVRETKTMGYSTESG